MNNIPENCEYDVKAISRVAKTRFSVSLLLATLLAIISILSIVSVILYGKNPLIFIISAVVLVLSLYFFKKVTKHLDFRSLNTIVGKISDIDVQIRTVRQIAGGVGLHSRQYDHYKHEETDVGIYIDEGDKITSYYVKKVTAKQVEYYRNNNEVIHIFATRFPIKLGLYKADWTCPTCKERNPGDEDNCRNCRCRRKKEWLCPLCGEFNSDENKLCNRCKRKIMK